MNCNTAIQDFLLENILSYVKEGCQKCFLFACMFTSLQTSLQIHHVSNTI